MKKANEEISTHRIASAILDVPCDDDETAEDEKMKPSPPSWAKRLN